MSIAPGTPLVTNLHYTPPLTAKIKVTTLKQRLIIIRKNICGQIRNQHLKSQLSQSFNPKNSKKKKN